MIEPIGSARESKENMQMITPSLFEIYDQINDVIMLSELEKVDPRFVMLFNGTKNLVSQLR
jgi:hypothetical protein